MSAATTTSVAAGRIVAEDLAVDRRRAPPARAMSVTNIRVRTTSAKREAGLGQRAAR